MKSVWVYYRDELLYVNAEILGDLDFLVSSYPDAIYFYAGVELFPWED